jgi:hypothetical protein
LALATLELLVQKNLAARAWSPVNREIRWFEQVPVPEKPAPG